MVFKISNLNKFQQHFGKYSIFCSSSLPSCKIFSIQSTKARKTQSFSNLKLNHGREEGRISRFPNRKASRCCSTFRHQPIIRETSRLVVLLFTEAVWGRSSRSNIFPISKLITFLQRVRLSPLCCSEIFSCLLTVVQQHKKKMCSFHYLITCFRNPARTQLHHQLCNDLNRKKKNYIVLHEPKCEDYCFKAKCAHLF